VIEILETIALERGAYPQRLTVDNGPELRSRALDQWAYAHGVELAFIQPGKPTQNAYAESCNGRMRDELLNTQWWTTLAEARAALAHFRQDYNTVRPHRSLGQLTPLEYAARWMHQHNPGLST
jgi:putative transposase